jgi:hypothetical protein
MTGKQIEQAKEELNSKYYGDECRVPENLKQPWSKKDKVLEEELDCREMINSILIYGGNCSKDSYQYKRYLKPFIEGDQWHKVLLSEQRVDELIAEQKADFAKATVGFAGYDSEGCSYNYCHWADEQ